MVSRPIQRGTILDFAAVGAASISLLPRIRSVRLRLFLPLFVRARRFKTSPVCGYSIRRVSLSAFSPASPQISAVASLWRDLSRFADAPEFEERRRFPAWLEKLLPQPITHSGLAISGRRCRL